MNWLTFSILAYLAYALQLILAPLWSFELGEKGIEPMLLLVLLVYIGLQAPGIHVAWAAIVLGVLADVLQDDYQTALIGPWAIGMLAAGYALIQMRNLLFKDSMFTIGIMTLVAGIFALLVTTTLYTMRDNVPLFGNTPVVGYSAFDELYYGFAKMLYTAAVAIPVGYLLLKSQALWGFNARRSMR